MPVVVEEHVEERVEDLGVGVGRFQHSRKPGWSEGCRLYLDQNLSHGQTVRELGGRVSLEQSVVRLVVRRDCGLSYLGLEWEGSQPAEEAGDLNILVVHHEVSTVTNSPITSLAPSEMSAGILIRLDIRSDDRICSMSIRTCNVME